MASTKRHIVAIGGLPSDSGEVLLDYILNLARSPHRRLGFIGTASGDAESYCRRFESLADRPDCTRSRLPFFGRTPDVAEWVNAQDVILVGGGNTKSMLAVWHEWELPELLRVAWNRGTVLAGWSAGAICWFEQGVTDSFASRLEAMACLGFLPGSCCPHYSGELDRRPGYHQLLTTGQIAAGIAIDDGVGVHFIEEAPHAIVATGPERSACTVICRSGEVTEQPLPIRRVDLG